MDDSTRTGQPFVARPNEYERLVSFLIDQRFFLPVALTTSLPGGRGFGKTSLARAVCQDPRVRAAFTDGVAWITLGAGLTPLELLSRMHRLIFELSGERVMLESVDQGAARLHELLHPRRTLLVIDDADDERAIAPFFQSGPGGACLLITHDDASLPISARRVPLDIMVPSEAAALLLRGLLASANGGKPSAAAPASAELPAASVPGEVELDETAARDFSDIPEGEPDYAVLAESIWEPDSASAPEPARMASLDELALASVVGASAPPELEQCSPLELRRLTALADLLNDWPLLLGLANGWLRSQRARGMTPDLATLLQQALDVLERQGLKPGWSINDPRGRKQALDAVLAACLEPLQPLERERFLELSVYPAARRVPVASAAVFWDLSLEEARALCRKFAACGLVDLDEGGPDGEAFTLGYAVHAALRDQLWAGQLVELNNRLVDRYRARCSDGWASGPDDGYYYKNLCAHLTTAQRTTDLHALLFDFDWLARWLDSARRTSLDLTYLLADYERALSTALDHQSAQLRLVLDALRMAAPVLVRDPAQLAPQLLGRLLPFDEPEVRAMIDKARDYQGQPWMRPLASCFTPPGVGEVRVMTGHEDWVTGVGMLPDGRRALSSSLDGTLCLWDLATGQQERILEAHQGALSAVKITPDGLHAVSAGWDGTLKVWNLAAGKEVRAFKAHLEPVGALAITPDGRTVITGADDRLIRAWDIETGKLRLELIGHGDLVRALAITPDGRTLVSGAWDNTLRLWDLETGKLLHILTGHQSWVRSVAVSPDGSTAVSGAWDRTVRVWDLWTGETLRMAGDFESPVISLAVTPDSRWILAGGGGGAISLLDFLSMQVKAVLPGHPGGVNDLAFTPGGRFFVSGGGDRSLRVWDLGSVHGGPEQLGHDGPVFAVQALQGGEQALTGSSDGTLKVWEVGEGREVLTLKGHKGDVLSMAVTGDGGLAISGARDCTVRVWDLREGAGGAGTPEVRILRGHQAAVTAVAVTPDGRMVVSGDESGAIRAWDLQDGSCVAEFRGESGITACALSADGRTIAASGATGKMYFLEIKR